MKTPRFRSTAASLFVLLACHATFVLRSSAQSARDIVSGNLMQFDDNGAWTWYSDERAVVDTSLNKLVVGCVENGNGLGGTPRDGDINVTICDLPGRRGPRYLLTPNLTSFGGGDDHNAPALLILPNGQYLAMYTGHNADQNTIYNIYDPPTDLWSPAATNDWNAEQPGNDGFNTTYSNPNYLAAENRTYDFARGTGHGSQNIITSTNFGSTWNYGGEMTTNANVGYVNGYFRYWGNGIDRVDFICTEYHPRDFSTSIYHGYVSNGMTFNSFGAIRDTNIFDKLTIPTPQSFTPVFTTGTVMPQGQTNYRCWNDDVCRYPDGTIECIISARINNDTQGNDAAISPNHAFFFCRFDGVRWTTTYLCRAGYKLYSSEADYVGLGCLHPNDPNTIFVSTTFDPRTDTTNSAIHEIWKGVTTNQGASFSWTAITKNSVRENFRPIVPAWDKGDTALLWFRGTYTSAQILNMAVVGIVDQTAEVIGMMHYMDATTNNTTLTNGAPLVLNAAANRWHLQTGVGNGSTVISSADSIAEDASNLVTQVTVPGPGVYDVWVNFWGNPAADWRISAGLSANTVQTYRSVACKAVQPGDHDTALVLTNNSPGTNYLYQAYIGRIALSNNLNVNVFVDDNALQTGGGGTTLIGNTARTWYDGVSFAAVTPVQIKLNIMYDPGSTSATLSWDSVSPLLSSLSSVTYSVQKKNALDEQAWTTLVTGLPSAGNTTSYVDTSASGSAAYYRVTSP